MVGLNGVSGSPFIQQGTGISSHDAGGGLGMIASVRIGPQSLANQFTGATVAIGDFGDYDVTQIQGTGADIPIVQVRSNGTVIIHPAYRTNSTNPIILRNRFFDDTSFADLGLTSGVTSTATWTTTDNAIESITFRTVSYIPEPSVGLLGMLGAGLVLRRKR